LLDEYNWSDTILFCYLVLATLIGVVYGNYIIAKLITRFALPLRLRENKRLLIIIKTVITLVLTLLILMLIGNSHLLVI